MKKVIIVAMLLFAAISIQAQDNSFPLSEILYKTKEELRSEGFNYNSRYNRLDKKKNTKLKTGFILALFGAYTDLPPDNDFLMTIQWGQDEPAWINYRFYNDEEYIRISSYLKIHGDYYMETDLGHSLDISCRIGDYGFSLRRNMNIAQFEMGNYSSSEPYNTYTYMITTGVPEYSPKLQRQGEKKAKKTARKEKRRQNR